MPELEPTVRVHSADERAIPYEIMRWFMGHIAEQVELCRGGFAQGKEAAD